MFVIPRKDYSIVDPARVDVLPPEGRDVGDGHPTYWGRRIADGDVKLVAEEKVDAAKATLERADAARAQAVRDKAEADEKAAKEKTDAAAKAAAPAPESLKPVAPAAQQPK